MEAHSGQCSGHTHTARVTDCRGGGAGVLAGVTNELGLACDEALARARAEKVHSR